MADRKTAVTTTDDGDRVRLQLNDTGILFTYFPYDISR